MSTASLMQDCTSLVRHPVRASMMRLPSELIFVANEINHIRGSSPPITPVEARIPWMIRETCLSVSSTARLDHTQDIDVPALTPWLVAAQAFLTLVKQPQDQRYLLVLPRRSRLLEELQDSMPPSGSRNSLPPLHRCHLQMPPVRCHKLQEAHPRP